MSLSVDLRVPTWMDVTKNKIKKNKTEYMLSCCVTKKYKQAASGSADSDYQEVA